MMRASLSAALFSLLPSIVVASASREACLHLKADDLAQGAACGDKSTLRNCFATVLEPISINTMEKCFVGAGCTLEESMLEARWMVRYCDSNPDELKRRRPEAILARATATTAEITATTAPTTGTTSTPLVCSTSTTTSSTSWDSGSASSTVVQVATMVCAAGMICQTSTSGEDVCMKREDNLTISGAIITIFLAVVITVMIGTIVFLCCKDRKQQKSLRAKAEAAAIAKENADSSQRPEVGRTASGTEGGHDPFSDGQAPRL